MEQIRAARLGALLIAGLAVLISACTSPAGAGVWSAPTEAAPVETAQAGPIPVESEPAPGLDSAPAFDLPDITARPISINELTSMLAVLDRSDEVHDIARYGRVTGIAAAYPSDASTAHVWIDVFETAEGAAGWVSDTAEDIVKRLGGSHQAAIDLTAADDYPLGVGQDSVGLILGLDGGTRTETIAMFHIGRIAVFASIVGPNNRDLRVRVQYLAEDAAARVMSVLMGSSPAAPATADPDSYEFTFERIVEIGDKQWMSTASGTIDGDAVACSATLDLPSLRVERDLIWVGGRLCPAWPVDLAGAGLAGALTDTPARHDINGTPALGYRGTGADLEQALGLDPFATTIQVFNLWIAENTAWIIEMDLALSGDTTMLAQLIGAGFPEGESASVTISQRIKAIGEAGRVIPPG